MSRDKIIQGKNRTRKEKFQYYWGNANMSTSDRDEETNKGVK